MRRWCNWRPHCWPPRRPSRRWRVAAGTRGSAHGLRMVDANNDRAVLLPGDQVGNIDHLQVGRNVERRRARPEYTDGVTGDHIAGHPAGPVDAGDGLSWYGGP